MHFQRFFFFSANTAQWLPAPFCVTDKRLVDTELHTLHCEGGVMKFQRQQKSGSSLLLFICPLLIRIRMSLSTEAEFMSVQFR